MPLLFQGCNGGKCHYDEQLHSASPVPSVSFLIQKLSFEEVLRVRDSVENACYVANLPLHLKQIFQMTRYGSWYLPVITLYNNISVDGWTCKLSVTLKLRRTHQLGQYTQDD